MLRNMIFMLIVATSLFGSCTKDAPIPSGGGKTPPSDSSRFDVVWQTLLRDGTERLKSFKPILFENNVITSAYRPISGDIEEILSFDKQNGANIWKWNDYLFPDHGEYNATEHQEISEEYMYVPTEEGIYTIDVREGATIWSKPGRQLSFPKYTSTLRWSVLDNMVFHPFEYGSPNTDSCSIKRIDLTTGKEDEFFTIPSKDGFNPWITRPVAYYDENGDVNVLFYVNYWKTNPALGSVDLYNFNYSKSRIKWHLSDIDPDHNGSAFGPVLKDESVFIFGNFTVFCIDKEMGNIKWHWRYSESGGYSTSVPTFDNECIYFKTNSGHLVALNQETGDIKWLNNNWEAGAASFGVVHHKGKLYFDAGYLYVADAESGEILEEYESPNQGNDFPSTRFSRMTIDEENDLMYVCDGYHLMCLKIKW